jgi:hypothetical protein
MMRQPLILARRGMVGAVLAAMVLVSGLVSAYGEEFDPEVGQPGKDVVWVPTPDTLVERMLRMAQVTPQDYVVDLGSGDGKIVIAAVRDFNARALGIEFNPDMVALAKRNARQAGVEERARFIQGDIFEEDFSSATVVTMYLLPQLNLRLRETVLQMKPGTRVVSHAFDMSDWAPDESATVDGRSAFLWIVPANVGGSWRLNLSQDQSTVAATMSIKQEFQNFAGTISLQGSEAALQETRLVGPRIEFAITDADGERRRFVGSVEGGYMRGTVSSPDGRTAEFRAER